MLLTGVICLCYVAFLPHSESFSFFFSLHRAACRILVPWPGMEPTPPAVEAQSPNYWTARQVPPFWNLVVVVQLLTHVWVFMTPWTTAHQAYLSFTISQSLLKLMFNMFNAIQPSHPLLPPSPLALNLSQHQNLFQWVISLHQVARVLQLQLQHQSFQWIFRILHAMAKKKKRPKGGGQRWGKVCAGTGQGAHLQRRLWTDAELIISLIISEISINPGERPVHTHQFPSQEQTNTADMSSYFCLPCFFPDQASGGRAKCVCSIFFFLKKLKYSWFSWN